MTALNVGSSSPQFNISVQYESLYSSFQVAVYWWIIEHVTQTLTGVEVTILVKVQMVIMWVMTQCCFVDSY